MGGDVNSKTQLPLINDQPKTNVNTMADLIQQYGWTAVPRSPDKLVASRINPQSSKALKIEDIPLPDDNLSQEVIKYAKANLPIETFNHSMRVYFYGTNPTPFITNHTEPKLTPLFRPRNNNPTLPLLVLHAPNPPPNSPPSRHRHNSRKPVLHQPVLRVQRRLARS